MGRRAVSGTFTYTRIRRPRVEYKRPNPALTRVRDVYSFALARLDERKCKSTISANEEMMNWRRENHAANDRLAMSRSRMSVKSFVDLKNLVRMSERLRPEATW